MEPTDLIIISAFVCLCVAAGVIAKLRATNKELHRHLRDLARDYQIEHHRATVYFMRLRERQHHDGFGGDAS